MERVLAVGLEEPEVEELRALVEPFDIRVIAHDTLPRIVVEGSELRTELRRGPGMVAVTKVVYHSIFENDLDFFVGLALWGGPCLPRARAMMDCRLKLPCLVRALEITQFGTAQRGYASPHALWTTGAEDEHVAKWGNWHCGENKARFSGAWTSEEPCVVEPFLPGQAVRVVVIGERSWQIRLEGQDWLKSIHAPAAAFMPIDAELVADTRAVGRAFGLEILANDYIIADDGTKHLLEVNHIPNVTRFEEIRAAYLEYAANWLRSEVTAESCQVPASSTV